MNIVDPTTKYRQKLISNSLENLLRNVFYSHNFDGIVIWIEILSLEP